MMESEENKNSIDFRSLLVRFMYNWYWFLISIAFAIAAGFLYLRYADETFKVKSTILIKDEKKSNLSQEAVVKQLEKYTDVGGDDANAIEDVIQVLKSPSLMRRVIDSLKLNIEYYGVGRIRVTEIYEDNPVKLVPLFSADSLMLTTTLYVKTDANQQDFTLQTASGKDSLKCQFGVPFQVNRNNYLLTKNKDVDAGLYKIIVKNPEMLANKFVTDKVTVNKVQKSNALNLSIVTSNTKRGLDILYTLIREYNNKNLEDKNQAGNQTLKFIEDRVRYISNELETVEGKVEGFKKSENLNLALPAQAQNYVTRLNASDKELLELDVKAHYLSSFKDYLIDEKNRFKSIPIGGDLGSGSSSLTELIKKYNEKLQEREEKLRLATPDNPFITRYDRELTAFRQNLLQSLQTAQDEVEIRTNKIQQEVKPLEKQISALPNNERELLQIERQQKLKETIFIFLLQKREETALSIAAKTNNAQFLGRPILEGKVFPKKDQVLILLSLLGFLLPAGVFTVLHLLDNKLRNSKDITSRTNTPFLGTLAFTKNETAIVVNEKSRSAISEMFRHLRTNLQFIAPPNAGSRVILVTSPESGDGKTFVALNIGATFSLSDKKVVVLGLDFRRPKLSLYLNKKKDETGITNYLMGETALNQLVLPTSLPNLFYIDCGPIPPNPSELMMAEPMRNMIAELRKEFDYIILDSAPFALVTDSFLLKDIADTTLIVVRFKKTRFQLVDLLEEIFSEKRLPQMGVVLNGVEAVRGYGYNYGYGYGYGYGYSTDEKEK